mmetsp:Transcript_16603/g.46431  ORF Transcript_16603/g.46431 Transcript_16603/m.46431 type:complete len:418 (+) Transcript_16603:378-1631(+)
MDSPPRNPPSEAFHAHDLALAEDDANTQVTEGTSDDARPAGLMKSGGGGAMEDIAAAGDDLEKQLDYARQKRKVQRRKNLWMGGIFALLVVLLLVVIISSATAKNKSSKSKSSAVDHGDNSYSTSEDAGSSYSSSSDSGEPMVTSGSSDEDESESSSVESDRDVVYVDQLVEYALSKSPSLHMDQNKLDQLLNQPMTPQLQAMEYMTSDDKKYLNALLQTHMSAEPLGEAIQTLSLRQIDTLVERYAVLVLYFSLNGHDWNKSGLRPAIPVLNSESICEWNTVDSGLKCSTDGSLDVIDFTAYELSGTLPTEIGVFKALRVIFLDRNEITGPIPSEIGVLSQLRNLYLDHNQLSGVIPDELTHLDNLLSTRLDNNNLTGNLTKIFCDNHNGINSIEADCFMDPPEVECSCCLSCGGV